MKITGKNIYIRDLSFNDAEDYFEMASDPVVGMNAGWKPHENIKITRNVLAGLIFSKETFAICLRTTKKMIGTISLYSETFRKNVNAKNIGFSINPLYWNNGYATEAAKLIIAYAFNHLNAEIVAIGHHIDNISSKRVIEKIGFSFEGIIRKYKRLYDNRVIDAAIYSMTKSEFERKEIEWQNN